MTITDVQKKNKLFSKAEPRGRPLPNLRQIKSWHALAQGAEQVRAGGVGDARDIGNGLGCPAVRAVDCSDIAHADRWYSSYVGGGEVHRNRADNRGEVAADDREWK